MLHVAYNRPDFGTCAVAIILGQTAAICGASLRSFMLCDLQIPMGLDLWVI